MSKTFALILALAVLIAAAGPAVEEYMPMHPGAVAETGYGVTVAPLRRSTSIDPEPAPRPRPLVHRNMVTLKLPSRPARSESRLRIVEAVPGKDGALDFSNARTVQPSGLAEIPGMIDPEVLALEQYNLTRPEPLSLPGPIEAPEAPAPFQAPELPFELPPANAFPNGKIVADMANMLDEPPAYPPLPEFKIADPGLLEPPKAPPQSIAPPKAMAMAVVTEPEPPPAKPETRAPEASAPAAPTPPLAAAPGSSSLRPPGEGSAASLKPPEALAAPARPLAPPPGGFVGDFSPPSGPLPMMSVRDGTTVGLASMGMGAGFMPAPVFDPFADAAAAGPHMPPAGPGWPGQQPPHASRPTPKKSEPPRITMPEPDEFGLTPMRDVKNLFAPALLAGPSL